jgi:small conductance mechanosensitive channel
MNALILRAIAVQVFGQTGPSGPTGPTAPTGAEAAGNAVNQSTFQKAETFAAMAEKWIKLNGPSLVGAILLFAGAWIVGGWVRRAIRRTSDRTSLDPTLGRFASNVARWLIVLLAAVACMEVFGIKTASFAALIGAAGLAVGLGFQGSLGNFAAGVMLLLFRPFKVGDTVVVAGQTGKINEIDLLITELDTADGRRILIPNGQIFGAVIENCSHHQHRRVDINIVLPHAADLDRSRAVLEGVVRALKFRVNDPASEVALTDITPANVTWALRLWTNTDQAGAAKDALIRETRLALERAGIPLAPPAPPPPTVVLQQARG